MSEPKPAEYYCKHCKGDLVLHAGGALGQFHVHAHNMAVACVWPGAGWSLFGTNAEPVRRLPRIGPDDPETKRS